MIAGILIVYLAIFCILYRFCKKHCFLYAFILLFFIIPYIFLNCNPYPDNDMDKKKLLDYVPPQYKPVTEIYDPSISYNFPFILKPNKCAGLSKGVAIIKSQKQLHDYLQTNKGELVIQQYIDSKYEVGILYEKNPLSNKGNIISIIERKFTPGEILVPFEISYDDKDNIEMTKTMGNFYDRFVDLTPYKTEHLERVIQKISSGIPEFNVGRYDIRCNSLEELMEGKKFYILEVNGSVGFDLRKDLYFFIDPRSVLIQLRFVCIRLFYGLLTIFTLRGTNPLVMFQAYYNAFTCEDWQMLFKLGY